MDWRFDDLQAFPTTLIGMKFKAYPGIPVSIKPSDAKRVESRRASASIQFRPYRGI
jgi:hypothetical protein